MSDVLPNFSNAEEMLGAANAFTRSAAAVCEKLAGNASTRAGLFLHHAAQLTTKLADALASYCEDSTTLASQEYTQYTPLEPAPGESELERLAAGDAEAMLPQLQDAAKRWQIIFEHNEEHATAAAAKEMYASCRDLFRTWSKDLSTAYVQRDDM